MASRYSKANIAISRNKPYMKDEVTAEIQTRLKKKEYAERCEIANDILTREALKTVRTPSQFISSKKTGLKTRVQQLADAVEIPDEMPVLPPYLQIFAFRYATEVRKHVDWAAIFHTSVMTIRYWLLKPDVMAYILKLRQERQFLMLERVTDLERRAYEKLGEIMDTPIDGDTIESIRKASLDILNLQRGGEPKSDLPTININNNVNADAKALSYQVSKSSVQEVKERLEELDMIDAEVEDVDEE